MSVVTDRRHRVTRVDHEQQQGKIKKNNTQWWSDYHS